MRPTPGELWYLYAVVVGVFSFVLGMRALGYRCYTVVTGELVSGVRPWEHICP